MKTIGFLAKISFYYSLYHSLLRLLNTCRSLNWTYSLLPPSMKIWFLWHVKPKESLISGKLHFFQDFHSLFLKLKDWRICIFEWVLVRTSSNLSRWWCRLNFWGPLPHEYILWSADYTTLSSFSSDFQAPATGKRTNHTSQSWWWRSSIS